MLKKSVVLDVTFYTKTKRITGGELLSTSAMYKKFQAVKAQPAGPSPVT